MSIIKAKLKNQKEQLRINIESPIFDQIKNYCKWADIQKYDEFFEQAAEYVLKKDKAWQEAVKKSSA